MKKTQIIVLLILALTSVWFWSSSLHAGGGLVGSEEANRQLRESTDSLSKTIDNIRFKHATSDLFELIQNEGADGVSSQDVIGIAQKHSLSPDQTLQLIGFLQQLRSLKSTSQRQNQQTKRVAPCEDHKGVCGQESGQAKCCDGTLDSSE